MSKADSLQDKDLSLSGWMQELSKMDPEEVQKLYDANGLLLSLDGYKHFSGKDFADRFTSQAATGKRSWLGRFRKQPIPDSLRWEVFERDNFTCQRCGSRKFLSADHIIPESKGGPTTLDNLQTLCKSCNSRKGAK